MSGDYLQRDRLLEGATKIWSDEEGTISVYKSATGQILVETANEIRVLTKQEALELGSELLLEEYEEHN